MSTIHAGHLPLQSSIAPFAKSLANAWRRVFRRVSPAACDQQSPAQMSRERLAEELLAPCAPMRPQDIRQAAYAGISAPKGTEAEAALARRLAIARELLCRDLRHHLQDTPVMEKPELLAEWLTVYCAGLDYEVFFVVYLSTQYRVIAIEPLFRGTLTQTSVYPREVVKGALSHRACAAAFAHNHPLGDAEPSTADRCLTQRLQQALALVDVRVLDHFIVAGPKHFSFAKQGLI